MPDTPASTQQSSRAMAAPAEIVLNTAADVSRANAWLPEPLHVLDPGQPVDVHEGGTVEVGRSGGPGRPWRVEVRLHPDDLTLRWRATEPTGWTGQLVVTDSHAGGSVAELRVAGGHADDDVQDLLDRALAALAEEVDQNFTAG